MVYVRMYLHLFKLDWVIMSIVILCILATALYGALSLAEKMYSRKHL